MKLKNFSLGFLHLVSSTKIGLLSSVAHFKSIAKDLTKVISLGGIEIHPGWSGRTLFISTADANHIGVFACNSNGNRSGSSRTTNHNQRSIHNRILNDLDNLAHSLLNRENVASLEGESSGGDGKSFRGSSRNCRNIRTQGNSPSLEPLLPPMILRIIYTLFLHLRSKSSERSRAVRIEHQEPFPPVLRPLIGSEVLARAQTLNSHHRPPESKSKIPCGEFGSMAEPLPICCAPCAAITGRLIPVCGCC